MCIKSGPRQAIIQAIIKCCSSLEIQFCAVGVEKAESGCGWNLREFPSSRDTPRHGGIPAISWPEKVWIVIKLYNLWQS